ncbi:MAG: hypothetical protein V4719_27025 [Planctomycetota bacterium]
MVALPSFSLRRLALVTICGLIGCESSDPPVSTPKRPAVDYRSPAQKAADEEWQRKVEYHKLTAAQIKQAQDWIEKLGPRKDDNSFVGTPAAEIQEHLDRSYYVLHLDDENIYGFYLSKLPRDPSNPEGPQMQFYVDKKSGKITRAGTIDILY